VPLVSRQPAQRSRAAVIHCEACLDLSKPDQKVHPPVRQEPVAGRRSVSGPAGRLAAHPWSWARPLRRALGEDQVVGHHRPRQLLPTERLGPTSLLIATEACRLQSYLKAIVDKTCGVLVNIVSIYGLLASPYVAPYLASNGVGSASQRQQRLVLRSAELRQRRIRPLVSLNRWRPSGE